MKRAGTRTSDFGVSKREGHDSSRFYGSKLYDGLRVDERSPVIDASGAIDESLLNKPMPLDGSTLGKLPDHSIHLALVPVAPFAGKHADGIGPHLDGVHDVIACIAPKLVTGGRMVVIVDDEVAPSVCGSCYWPFHAYIAPLVLELGLYMRGEVILAKRSRASHGSTSSRGPCTVAHVYSHGMVFSKALPSRVKKGKREPAGRTDTITRDQFLEYTKSVWTVGAEQLQGHPAGDVPRVEQAEHLIRFVHLYSFLEDTILLVRGESQAWLQEALVPVRNRCIVFVSKDGEG